MDGWPRPEEVTGASGRNANAVGAPAHEVPLPGELQGQIAAVLAGIFLSHRSASPRVRPDQSDDANGSMNC
jgi:hypothetical protein